MFNRILIANRGEIALRIIRACRELGVETVAVYSEADRESLHVQWADRAYCIGPPPPAESYLDYSRIISAAEIADVEAIHPGYGFLAEDPHFAEICESCRIKFIGPSAGVIRLLGNKSEARRIAQENRVQVVPGSVIVEDDQSAVDAAHEIGFPVMIKAASGGGGRGMRIAHTDASLVKSLHAAQAEAENAFGDGALYIERYVENPRHVEVQVLADEEGHAVHLFERDCSLQRRYQKLIEEAPSPAINKDLRRDLCAAAVKLVRAVGYSSAGTVEFILDRENRFYFIEMNARIQVEHPVSEMVASVDLLKAQISIAAGEPLRLKQRSLRCRGHAIECRINAEDPARNFAPSPGVVETFLAPGGQGVRVDSHLYAGYRVPANYDSLLAKLIVYQRNREEAIACMRRALGEFRIEGVKTTIPLHLEVLGHPRFLAGKVDTGFLEDMIAGR